MNTEITFERLLEREFAGIPVERWLIALAVLALATLVLGIVKRLLEQRLQRRAQATQREIDDLVADLVSRTRSFFLLAIAFFVAAHVLLAPDVVLPSAAGEAANAATPAAKWLGYIQNAFVIVTILQVGLWCRGLLAYGIQRLVRSRPADDPARTMGASILGFLGQTFLWSVVFLLCLANIGVDVTALITGLGVGGIAVALALQNILGDLFASITILLDKPCVVGDTIQVGDFTGTIERIGVKTTRLRGVDGEMIVMGNADLVSSRVRNYKQMAERRSVASIGITYQTPHATLAALPGILKEIVERTPNARFDRCHFQGFGESALVFELAYFTTSADYLVFARAQEAINLAIHARFERDGIEFAYPTRTVFVAGGTLSVPVRTQKELSRG